MSNPTARPLSTIEVAGLGLLAALYVAVAAAHAYLAPLTTGPDELAHYEYVNFIAEQGRLPATTAERGQAGYKSDQPPLYHLIAALPASLVNIDGPPILKRYSDHERRQLIARTRHAWGLHNTEDERWPYRGEVLRWHIGRWVSIFFGAATVVVTFFVARAMPPLNPPHREGSKKLLPPEGGVRGGLSGLLPLAAAAVVAFIPRFTLTGSMLNYETTLAFFAALFLWIVVRMAAKHGERQRGVANSREVWQTADDDAIRNTQYEIRNTKYAPRTPHSVPRTPVPSKAEGIQSTILLGLFAGLAIITKLSALILLVEIPLALGLMARAVGRSWKWWARTALVALGAAGATIAVWFGFVLVQFNTVAEDGLWTGLLRPLIAADSSDATTNRLLSFLTGGEAGFTAAIDNLDSGPPWEWAATFFRTFWVVGIEGVQPLGCFGLGVAGLMCGLAVVGIGLMWKEQVAGSGEQEAGSRKQGAGSEGTKNTLRSTQYGIRNTDHGPQTTDHGPRTPIPNPQSPIIPLLLLHLGLAFILPLIRYLSTFSLADTAQGRHVLFLAAPAVGILLVWGVAALVQGAGSRVAGSGKQLAVSGEQVVGGEGTQYAIRSTLFIPALFLLTWSLVQLYTMSYAYNPLLPVRTLPVPAEEIMHPVQQALNEYVTLRGYTTKADPTGQMLRVDLFWEAAAVSPTDYLTEVELIDSQGEVVSQWVGYSAQGRYPTRAWDSGDMVRDTAWLPTAGLAADEYTLWLSLRPAARDNAIIGQVLSTTQATVELGRVSLGQRKPVVSDQEPTLAGSAAAAAGYTVWQNGAPASRQTDAFGYRETILVTFDSPRSAPERDVRLVPANSDDGLAFHPARQWEAAVLFVVGPDWPTGNYRLVIDGFDEESSTPAVRVVNRWEREFEEPPLVHRLDANFADQVKLLGYDLPVKRANPGGGLPVTLVWRGLDWMGHSYTIFTKLLAADQTVHGGRDRLPQEGYHTLYWAPGEIVLDPFGVPVEPDAPDGIYYLNVGLYRTVAGQPVSLPLVQDGQAIDAASINIGPIKVGQAPSEFTLDSADPRVRLDQPFGNPPSLTLLGYDLEVGSEEFRIKNEESVPNGKGSTSQSAIRSPQSAIHLTLYWRSESLLPVDYTTFVHLRNASGEIVAQKDQPPLEGAYPTSLWEPGEVIADEIAIPLPPELPAGAYQIVMGLYEFSTGARLPVPDSPDNSVRLGPVEVTP